MCIRDSIIGDRCPRTPYGQIVSYIWKNICHLLYQASLMKVLETIGRLALPSGLLHPQERSERQHAAKLLMHAYQKLHEIALKGIKYTICLIILPVLQHLTKHSHHCHNYLHKC